MNSPMDTFPAPSATSTPAGGVFDRNPAPAFGNPRSPGGLPVKMAENLGASPGGLDTTFGTAIEMNGGSGGAPVKQGPMDSPFTAGE